MLKKTHCDPRRPNKEEVSGAVEWLVGPNVRLITQQEQKDDVAYELAHECLIPAVRKLAGKQLSEADRANQVLDRRVNEWLGNNGKPSYLLGWSEWRLVERNRPYLIWGAQRNQKEELLLRTKRRWQRHAWEISGVLVLMVGAISAWLSPWGQIQMVKWDMAKLSRGNEQRTLIVISEGLTSMGYFEQAAEVAARIDNPFAKARALGAVAQSTAKLGHWRQARGYAEQNTTHEGKAKALIGILQVWHGLMRNLQKKRVRQMIQSFNQHSPAGLTPKFRPGFLVFLEGVDFHPSFIDGDRLDAVACVEILVGPSVWFGDSRAISLFAGAALI